MALQFSSMEGEISRAKQPRLLSQNQIREIVIDSDSDEEKYYASEDTEDDEPRSPSRLSSISQPPSPDFSPAALKMRMMVMWQVNSHNHACGHTTLSTFHGQ